MRSTLSTVTASALIRRSISPRRSSLACLKASNAVMNSTKASPISPVATAPVVPATLVS
jgi:hypothetical protein